jgi:hypothetical protein
MIALSMAIPATAPLRLVSLCVASTTGTTHTERNLLINTHSQPTRRLARSSLHFTRSCSALHIHTTGTPKHRPTSHGGSGWIAWRARSSTRATRMLNALCTALLPPPPPPRSMLFSLDLPSRGSIYSAQQHTRPLTTLNQCSRPPRSQVCLPLMRALADDGRIAQGQDESLLDRRPVRRAARLALLIRDRRKHQDHP